jgi:hypothetical protein
MTTPPRSTNLPPPPEDDKSDDDDEPDRMIEALRIVEETEAIAIVISAYAIADGLNSAVLRRAVRAHERLAKAMILPSFRGTAPESDCRGPANLAPIHVRTDGRTTPASSAR